MKKMPHFEVLDNLNSVRKEQWIKLFCICFNVSYMRAARIFQKYEINQSKFCLVYLDGSLVASYSGIFMISEKLSVFMSTDTMSNGEQKGGSVLAANHLYKHLKQVGVDIICGYPNSNIRGLREKKLKWKYLKSLDLFVSFGFKNNFTSEAVFQINRPSRGFFRDVPGIFRLVGYESGRYAMLNLELTSKRKHSFAINLSKFFGFGRKTLYYRILNSNLSPADRLCFETATFDSNSIDVP